MRGIGGKKNGDGEKKPTRKERNEQIERALDAVMRDPESNLGEALRRIEDGQSPGDFTRTLRAGIGKAKDENNARTTVDRVSRGLEREFRRRGL